MSDDGASTIDRIMVMLREQAKVQAETDEMGYRAAMAILNLAEEIVGLPQTDQVLPSWYER